MLVFYAGLGKWILASGNEGGGQAQNSILHQVWTIPVQGDAVLLCNAPGTFERVMETVLQGMHCERAVLYLDDIILFSKDVKSHMERIEEIIAWPVQT